MSGSNILWRPLVMTKYFNLQKQEVINIGFFPLPYDRWTDDHNWNRLFKFLLHFTVCFFRNYAFVILVHHRLPVGMQSNCSNFRTKFMFQCMRAYRDYSKLQRINIKKKGQEGITKPTFPLVKWSWNNQYVDCLSNIQVFVFC